MVAYFIWDEGEAFKSHMFYFTLLLRREFIMKEGNFILLISKKTAHILNKKYGVRFGCGGISTSKTKHRKYYLCTSDKNMEVLNKIQNK